MNEPSPFGVKTLRPLKNFISCDPENFSHALTFFVPEGALASCGLQPIPLELGTSFVTPWMEALLNVLLERSWVL